MGIICIPLLAEAHGGGLDKYGCHHNRKLGGYHCHKGQFAGAHFKSKVEMLKSLKESRKSDTGSKHEKVKG